MRETNVPLRHQEQMPNRPVCRARVTEHSYRQDEAFRD